MVKEFKIVKENGDTFKLEKGDWSNTFIIGEWFTLDEFVGDLQGLEDAVMCVFFTPQIKKGEDISMNNKNYVKEVAKGMHDWCGNDKIQVQE